MIDWPDLNLPPINLLSLGRDDSPCQAKCTNRDGVCIGCKRTMEEIECWTLYDPHERMQIVSRIHSQHPEVFVK
jgi:predicted Fe-S protein YdhL (DUF1289 family)